MSSQSLSKDYMDIDEFLESQNLCEGLATLTESDSGDLTNITDPIDFALSADQLHEYTANQIDLGGQLKPVDSPVSSDEGHGKSVCSETASECSSAYDTNVNSRDVPQKSRVRTRKSKTSKSIADSSDARTTTWKVLKSQDSRCLATSVEIEGVAYTYNLVPTAKGRKPSRKSVPGSLKDQKYWDRRSKNNEAAKRSRDLRRRKEMLVASRAADLEIENEELKAEVTFLKDRVKMLNRKLQEKKY